MIGRTAVVLYGATPTEIGYAQGCTVEVGSDLIKEYKLGSDKPAILDDGNKSYRVTVDKMYIDKTYAELLTAGSPVDLEIRPAGTGVGKEKIVIDDVVFSRWRMTARQAGVILEGLEGEGINITIGTQ